MVINLPKEMWGEFEEIHLEALGSFWRKSKMKYFHKGFILSDILKIIVTVRRQNCLTTGYLIQAFSGLWVKEHISLM